jgi:ATP-dependent DNA helicase RecQ
MFTEFVPVNEDLLAKKAAISRDSVYQFLVRLSSQNIIRYIPGKKTPLVIFTEERLERKSLLISHENYHQVKEKYEFRVEKMLDYTEASTRCRSVLLLEYFGEESDRCGICDVCRERNELDLSKYEFDIILDEVKSILSKSKPGMEELVKNISFPEEKSVKVIRWLLDHDKIIRDPDLGLRWSERK